MFSDRSVSVVIFSKYCVRHSHLFRLCVGKVLITGGYLVLDPEQSGLVLSVSARFHSSIFSLDNSPIASPVAAREPLTALPVIVHSPQRGTVAKYELSVANNDIALALSKESVVAGVENNKFVELTLKHTLLVISSLLSADDFVARLRPWLFIHLLADRQFYTSAPETKVPFLFVSPLLMRFFRVSGRDSVAARLQDWPGLLGRAGRLARRRALCVLRSAANDA